jgi:hypothetical protein
MFIAYSQSVFPVFSLQNLVSPLLKNGSRKFSKAIIILYNQNGFRATKVLYRGLFFSSTLTSPFTLGR